MPAGGGVRRRAARRRLWWWRRASGAGAGLEHGDLERLVQDVRWERAEMLNEPALAVDPGQPAARPGPERPVLGPQLGVHRPRGALHGRPVLLHYLQPRAAGARKLPHRPAAPPLTARRVPA